MRRVLGFAITLAVIAAVLGFGISRLPSSARAGTAFADATSTFKNKCAKCHGGDGRGKSFRGKLTHARDLTESGWQNDVSDERIFNSISNGKGKMPAFKKELNESQINELVTYVRRFRR